MDSHVLLISCPDQPGLVHKISGVVFRQQLNIISNGEYVDKASSHFFMRTEFSGAFNRAQLERELEAVLPAHSIVYLRAQVKQNIVILATREHHCLSDLLIVARTMNSVPASAP